VIFHRKIAETAAAAEFAFPSAFTDIVAMAAALIGRTWAGIPGSACHGDMTLENLLLPQNRNTVFIDCDEPFISSYWLDLAKLCQDIDGHWCLRQLYLEGTSGPTLVNAAERLQRLVQPLRSVARRVASYS
jgi:hypothetical protein